MRKCKLLCLILALATLGSVTSHAAEPKAWQGQTVLITGANRGLGLELARQLHAAGATVIGTARRPEAAADLRAIGVRVEQLDVADAASVAALADRLHGTPLAAVFNNAGIFAEHSGTETADPAAVLRIYDVNAVGPLRVTQALLPNLRLGDRKLVMNMSSGLGSIANNSRGGMLGYRASKAALNMITRTMAADLAEEEFVVVAMSPGWVRTDMGGEQAPLSPAESVAGILKTLTPLRAVDSGRYLNHDGTELPW